MKQQQQQHHHQQQQQDEQGLYDSSKLSTVSYTSYKL